MVAYSFMKRFAPDIQSGHKTHTIRGNRKRHARVGEPIQLYCGMRTKHCFKIIPDPVCKFIDPIHILLGLDSIISIWTGPECSSEIFPHELEKFAQSDGFSDAKKMHEFWWDSNDSVAIEGLYAREFEGYIIGWGDRP